MEAEEIREGVYLLNKVSPEDLKEDDSQVTTHNSFDEITLAQVLEGADLLAKKVKDKISVPE